MAHGSGHGRLQKNAYRQHRAGRAQRRDPLFAVKLDGGGWYEKIRIAKWFKKSRILVLQV